MLEICIGEEDFQEIESRELNRKIDQGTKLTGTI